MPRTAAKSADEIFQSLKDLYVLDDTGQILNLSHSVWNDASEKLNNVMNKKYVYLYISQNRHGILDKLCEHYGVTCNKELSLTSDTSNISNWSMNQSNDSCPPLRSTVHLSKETWMQIAPIDAVYKGRSYKMLNKGWTDVIAAELWKALKLPCCFAFKVAKLNDSAGEIFLRIHGRCSECFAIINAYSMDKPTTDGLDLQVSTSDTKHIKHSKKRQLRGTHRKSVVKELLATSTYAWRREKANELMEFGDVEPAHLYGENVLRKAKQLENDRRLGINKIADLIQSINELRYKPEFAGYIRDTGINRCFVMYWSGEQAFLYKQFMKQDTNTRGILSIDATGSLIDRKSVV